MNSNYNYDDEAVNDDLEKAEMYWKGRDDGRLESGGGLYTLMGGVFIGAVAVSIFWIMSVIW
jgi:hypothetical protein